MSQSPRRNKNVARCQTTERDVKYLHVHSTSITRRCKDLFYCCPRLMAKQIWHPFDAAKWRWKEVVVSSGRNLTYWGPLKKTNFYKHFLKALEIPLQKWKLWLWIICSRKSFDFKLENDSSDKYQLYSSNIYLYMIFMYKIFRCFKDAHAIKITSENTIGLS